MKSPRPETDGNPVVFHAGAADSGASAGVGLQRKRLPQSDTDEHLPKSDADEHLPQSDAEHLPKSDAEAHLPQSDAEHLPKSDAEHLPQSDAEDRLQQSDAALQEFILGAVHELREPLRAVNAYCELLSKSNAASGDAEADLFRGYIMAGTSKIQTLLTGMVDYAAAGAADGYIFRVDVNDVLRSAESSAAFASGRQVHVTHGPLPSVRGDFEKLVKIFRRLLENAAQYCEAEESRIHVTSRRDGSDWLFAVKDNGPGIDASYHQRIFAPFKRLHGKQNPGLGLGLAFCRRALESQGGRIWVESEPGGGSVFCFTLPADDEI